MADDQTDVIRFLMDPATYGGQRPEHIETHGAHVFLAGDTALKIKRAVRYDYLDFSRLNLREAMLRRELELNAAFAPQIYRDVIAVTRDTGGLRLGGDGAPVEWVLRMNRFPRADELSVIAESGGLDDGMAAELGHVAARYHAAAPLRDGDGAAMMTAIADELDAAFAGMQAELGTERLQGFRSRLRAELSRVAPLLEKRARDGHLRRCHGDLHLHNLVLIDGRPVPFDALEFDETLGTCDVLYDLAFLLMDLEHRGLGRAANIVLGAWLFEAGGAEDAGLRALPLFLAVRAAIRAMVEIQTDRASAHPGRSDRDAQAYLDQALAALSPAPPRLVAIGGVSGTGKTTLARTLAPMLGSPTGAVHLRSDLERKRLAGVAPLTPLAADHYGPEASARVYARLLDRAEAILAAGVSVVVDATWLDGGARSALEALVVRMQVRFDALWLDAPETALVPRVAARERDASDADVTVLHGQIGLARPDHGWHLIDASGAPGDAFAIAREALQLS